MSSPKASSLGLGAAVVLGTCMLAAACSSSKTDTPAATTPTTSTAAAVSGAADAHCAGRTVTVSQAACTLVPDAGKEQGADGGAPKSDYGDTLYGSEGDDDDCKYHVKWQSTAVAKNTDVTFVIVVTRKSDGTPVTGATPDAEVFLDDTHPAPNSDAKTTETTPGTYSIGPVKLDAAGKWTARFHFFDSCNDNEESPHGHAAFFVQVP